MNKRIWLATLVLYYGFTNAQAENLNLDWLAGAWCRSSSNISGEEHWMRDAGGIMLGMSRTTTKRGTQYEFLRIELTPSTARYIATPSGQSETSFELTEVSSSSATFSNPTHDFPRRIRYWREGARLFARVDDGSGASKSLNFEWTRCEPQ